jgi:uncharacterized protein (TIGR02444 family)
MASSAQPSSLWDYAVACYQRPGVAEACLALQDGAGADVNLLLAGAWLAERNCRWQRDDVAALVRVCADWRSQCLLPLRQVRRYLKEKMEIEELYRQVKLLELEAERYQLHLIEEAIDHLPQQRDGLAAEELLSANLRICLGLPDRNTDAPRALAELLRVLRPG